MTSANAIFTRQPGRYLLSARDQHLVADATVARGGPGEAWTASELLLAALLTCAQAVLQSNARDADIVLDNCQISADSEPNLNKPGHFSFIRLRFELIGPTQLQAEQLVSSFTTVCPIYGSLSRGAPVTVEVGGRIFAPNALSA